FEVEEGKEVEATDAIYEIIGEDNALAGDALDVAISQKATGQETFNAAAILVPIVILILILSTSSWIEPIFFLIALGISILINFESAADRWISLGKGIVLSFISVMTFLPALTLLLSPLIDKTSHKQWLPTKYNVGKYILKFRFPALILIAIILVPAFFAQSN